MRLNTSLLLVVACFITLSFPREVMSTGTRSTASALATGSASRDAAAGEPRAAAAGASYHATGTAAAVTGSLPVPVPVAVSSEPASASEPLPLGRVPSPGPGDGGGVPLAVSRVTGGTPHGPRTALLSPGPLNNQGPNSALFVLVGFVSAGNTIVWPTCMEDCISVSTSFWAFQVGPFRPPPASPSPGPHCTPLAST